MQTPLKKSKKYLLEEQKNESDLLNKQVHFKEQPKPEQNISEADIS